MDEFRRVNAQKKIKAKRFVMPAKKAPELDHSSFRKHVFIALAAMAIFAIGFFVGRSSVVDWAEIEELEVQSIETDPTFNLETERPVDTSVEATKLEEARVAEQAIDEQASLVEEKEIVVESQDFILHKVRKGDTLGVIGKNLEIDFNDINAVYESFKKICKEKKLSHSLKVGTDIRFEFFLSDGAKTLKSVLFYLNKKQSVLVKRSAPDAAFVASLEEVATIIEDKVATGVIESSFAESVISSGLSYDIVDDVVDLFSSRMSFRSDIHKGDKFVIQYKLERLKDGEIISVGPIDKVLLQSRGRNFYSISYVASDGKRRFADKHGDLIGNTFLRYPLKFSRISSQFSNSRFHPVFKTRRPHNGVDFAAPRGTPVRTVADGRVLFAGRKGGAGIMVKVQHTSRYSTAYLHLSKIANGIRNGSRVKRGQVIGAVGSTGYATGPHLHYSFYDRGNYVDPLKVKLPNVEELTRMTRISSGELLKSKQYLEAKLDGQRG